MCANCQDDISAFGQVLVAEGGNDSEREAHRDFGPYVATMRDAGVLGQRVDRPSIHNPSSGKQPRRAGRRERPYSRQRESSSCSRTEDR